MFRAAFALLFALGATARADEKKPTIDDLAWLAGAWSSTVNGVETEEHWIAPKGGIMLGVNRTTRAKGKAAFEFLRIAERPDGVVYLPQPSGAPVTEFPLKELKGKGVTFENLKRDFPQRVIYKLSEKGHLVARIESEIQGTARSKEWTWEKAK